MSPYERVEALYIASPEARPFAWYVDYHHRHGFVFSRPDYFIMGRPVIKEADPSLICELTHRFPSGQCNCWFIFAMAGNMMRAWDIMPWPMPWFAWEREQGGRRDLRFYPTERIRKLSTGQLP